MAAANSSGALPCCKPPKVCSPPAVVLVGWDTQIEGVLDSTWARISLYYMSHSDTHIPRSSAMDTVSTQPILCHSECHCLLHCCVLSDYKAHVMVHENQTEKKI